MVRTPHKAGPGRIVDMESPGFWFLLIIPATAAVMAYQALEHPLHPHETHADRVMDQRVATTPTATYDAYVPPQAVRQTGSSADDSRKSGAWQRRESPPAGATGSASSPAEPQPPAAGQPHMNSGIAAVPNASRGVAVAAGASGNDRTTGIAMDHPANASDGPAVDTPLASILEDNPYLPVADEAYEESAMADAAAPPPCPDVLYRGGNDYARLRLAQMGCEIPGG